MQFVKSGGQNTVFSINNTLNMQGRLVDLTKRFPAGGTGRPLAVAKAK
jgi:hypothetical protein